MVHRGERDMSGAVAVAIMGANAFVGFTSVHTTAGVETIPYGATTLDIEDWGSGSGGANSGGISSPGVCGSSGSYARTTVNVAGLGGKTLNVSPGAAGTVPSGNGNNSTVTSGTLAIATMTSHGGGYSAGGAVSTGGTVTNTAGNACTGASAPGAAIVGLDGAAYGAGGLGGVGAVNQPGFVGGVGATTFRYR